MALSFTYEGRTVYPPTNDVVFKAIFAKEDNKDLLCSLLNSFLDLQTEGPEDIEIVAPEVNRKYYDDKLIQLDLKVKTAKGEHINVEIQVRDEHNMEQRSMYYVSTLFTDQLTDGMDYSELQRAVGLNLLCYNTKGNTRFIRRWTMHDRETLEEVSDKIELVFVELLNTEHADLKGLRGQWTTFLTADTEEPLKELCTANAMFRKAVDTLVYVSEEEEVRYYMDMKKKARLDAAARETRARREGEAKIIRRMVTRSLQLGLDPAVIADLTGSSLEEIESIRIELGKESEQ